MKRKVIYAIVCVVVLVSCVHKSGHRIISFASSENVIHESYEDYADEEIHIDKDIQVDLTYTEPYTSVLQRESYITSYNSETKCPNWVAWHLTAEHADGEIAREKSFYEDLDVPAPRATNEDYRRSGWSRGHMCPAGDNKWDEKAMQESNLLTNICPQNQELNSGVWNVIERDCRKWAKKYGDVYIVCGPILLNKDHETIGLNKVVVPEAFFKVVLRMNPKPAAIGFVIRNNEGKKKRDQFANTVDDVERITGYDFFPALPDDIEDVVESTARIEDWR
jgi:endonuclease G